MDYQFLHRKERIILTAIDLIDEFGVHAISTREIAKRQGVSEGTIFKHFPTKNDLIKGVLDHFSQYDNALYHSAKHKVMRPKDAILFLIDSYLIYYENYPAITAITQAYDILRYDPELAEKITGIFRSRWSFVNELLDKAIKEDAIKPGTDLEILTDIITSTCRGIILKWRLDSYGFSLREKMLQAIKVILDAFLLHKKGLWR